jgi:aminopeptidase N
MSMRSLTQVEAERRAALLTVERYDVAIDLTDLPTGPRVYCVSTITFSCRESGTASFVDCAAQVLGATLNGAALGPADEGRIALPQLAEHNVLRVESVQENTKEGQGVHKAVDPADGETYLWTSFAPDEARHVWACFDQPDLKAPHAFTVTAPAAWSVVSNSGDPVIEQSRDARRWSFPATAPLSPYNTVINAGPFHEVRREVRGHDLGLFARRSLAAVLDRDADALFTLTEQGLGFFADVFGMPFPQRKYDQVFVPEFGGAMENYGCVTWSDSFLHRTESTPAERLLVALILLHEMSHMWFGNIVTMRWWDDLWLNEAFAEFACHWAATNATRYTDAWAGHHLAVGKTRAYLADQGPTSHPIRLPIRDVREAASIFDAITYPKGASVLRQLMAHVGEDAFKTGLTQYFARHAWGNTTLQDLTDALAEASGRDLSAWRAGWLETAGTDRLALEQDGENYMLVASGPGGGRPRPHTVMIGAYESRPDGLERVALTAVEVRQPRTPLSALPSGADFYLVNDDDLTFATTRPVAAGRAALLATAALLPSAISRGVAVATVRDMLINGEATAAESVQCLITVLERETSDAVIEPYLALASEIAELWSPSAERSRLTGTVADVCRRIARDPSRRRVALRTLAGTAGDLDEVAWLRKQAADDVDLQWRALVRAAEFGAKTDDESERLLERDPNPDAWIRALAVRAAAPDPIGKQEVWRLLTDERKVPVGSVGAIATAFWRPGRESLLTPYAERYLTLLSGFDRGGISPAMVFTKELFPLHGIDHSFVERARAAAAETVPVVRKTLLEQADVVSRMLRSRG